MKKHEDLYQGKHICLIYLQDIVSTFEQIYRRANADTQTDIYNQFNLSVLYSSIQIFNIKKNIYYSNIKEILL